MDKQALMDQMYEQDINAFIGLDYSHMGFWKQENDSDFHQAQEESLRQLTKNLDIKPEAVVLDIGGGQGGTAIWLCQTFGCKVVVVDIVQSMIEQAKIKVESAGLSDRIQLVCSDILDYQTDQVFEHIISVEALHHIKETDKLFQKCSSLLKTGGTLAASIYWSNIKYRWLKNQYLMLTVGDKSIPRLKDYQAALESAGFYYSNRDISNRVLPKSTQQLRKKPYIDRIKKYHVKHFGKISLLFMPLFMFWHDRVIKKNQLRLVIFEAMKKSNDPNQVL